MLTVVGAGKASPGATAAAIALALAWPREVLLVDGDPAGGDVLAGLLPGRASADAGLLTWSAQTRRESAMDAVTAIPGHVLSLPEAPTVWVMPGVQSAVQSSAVVAGWARIAQALERVSSTTGRDVIVDAGRFGEASCWPVAAAADQVVVVARGSARSVTATVSALELLTRKIGDTDLAALLVLQRGPYSPAQVAAATGCPLLGCLGFDASAAAVLTEGAASGLGRLRRSRLMRSATQVARSMAELGARDAATSPPAGPSRWAAGTSEEREEHIDG
jgi:MinD-like ATPase involved in chromosome partitioning or flagellar assembly